MKISYFSCLLLLLPVLIFIGGDTKVLGQGALSLSSIHNQNLTAGMDCNNPNAYRVVLVFNRNMTVEEETALTDPQSYRIFQILPPGVPPKDPSATTLAPPVIDVVNVTSDCCNKHLLYICPRTTLDATFEDQNGHPFQPYQYILFLEDRSGKVFKNIVTKVLTTATFSANTNKPANISSPATYDVRESESKEDSNVYISGEVTGAHKSSPAYSTDIKIKIPMALSRPQPNFFFDLQASSSPKADPDSMDIGVELADFKNFNFKKKKDEENEEADGRFTQPANQACVTTELTCQKNESGFIFSRLDWSAIAKIESDRDFDNTNFVVGGKLTFPIFPINTRSTRWTLKLFGGLDAGKNLKSPVALAKGRGIMRPFAGASMFVGILRKGKVFPFSFEGNYTHRWLLARELKLVEDDDGNLVAAFFSKRPRYFIDTKFTLQFNEYWGAYAGYQYGEKPPTYKLVDSSFKVGLVFKFKFKGINEE